jgi:hypothetical protein
MMKMKVVTTALLATLGTIGQAFAGGWELVSPPPAPPAAVPEIDVSSGLAVMALLISICAMLYSRRKQS